MTVRKKGTPREERRRLEATFPKCITCGRTVGLLQQEEGKRECRSCEEQRVEADELEKDAAWVRQQRTRCPDGWGPVD